MLGPIELLVIGFPGSEFSGGVLPELERLAEAGTITVVDAMVLIKNEDGSLDFLEISQVTDDHSLAALGNLIDEANGLISDEDLEEFAEALDPGDSAALLAFEHTWFKPLRDELFDSGGVLLANMRIPGIVVEEVLAAVAIAEAE
jgi:uncharacterized membrane protein